MFVPANCLVLRKGFQERGRCSNVEFEETEPWIESGGEGRGEFRRDWGRLCEMVEMREDLVPLSVIVWFLVQVIVPCESLG